MIGGDLCGQCRQEREGEQSHCRRGVPAGKMPEVQSLVGVGIPEKEYISPYWQVYRRTEPMDLCNEETGAPSLKSQINVALRFSC